MSRLGNATLDQVGATAPATAVTLAAVAVMGSHHAPAATTAVLVQQQGRPARPRPVRPGGAGDSRARACTAPGVRTQTVEVED